MLDEEKSNLLDLEEKGIHIIYKIIDENFKAINQTLTIMNGKYYVNWINIQPLSLDNYQNSRLYTDTIENFERIDEIAYETDTLDGGIWLGNYYNVIRNFFL